MSPRSKAWFEKAVAKGIDPMTAYMGTEVIDSWCNFWKFEIPDDSLDGMMRFAMSCPEGALHRWSILAGPRPFLPSDEDIEDLKSNPKYSALDTRDEQCSREQ